MGIGKYLDCPNPGCNNQGWYIVSTTGCEHGCCGNYMPTGECCGNSIPVPVDIAEQVQCEFCYTEPMSKFNNQADTDRSWIS